MLYDPKWEAPTPVLSPVQRVLLAAANYIEKFGWCQHVHTDRDGRVCAIGALRVFTATDGLLPYAIANMQLIVGDFVPDWNDRPGRTKEEVIAALRKAATL